MHHGKPILSVIDGRADARDRIALSLVHPREQIDIPVKAVRTIEAIAERTFFLADGRTSKTYRLPHVLLAFAPYLGARIHRLTARIVGEELAILVAGTIVSRPVVREPHGLRETLCIDVNDMEQAEALVAKLREGWAGPALRVV